MDEIIAEYDVAKKEGDANRIATWAGLGCPLLTKTTENPKVRMTQITHNTVADENFQDIMNELVEECFARLKDVCITVEK